MIAWKNERKTASDKGELLPTITNYIADCIYRIATRLSYRPNFIRYSYREEMIGDGLETCIRYADRFNPEKYDNPFSYFTTICYNAFVQRIKKEKRQSDIRNNLIRSEVQTYDTMGGKFADDTYYSCFSKNGDGSHTLGGYSPLGFDPVSPATPKKKIKKVVTPKLKGLEVFMDEPELVTAR